MKNNKKILVILLTLFIINTILVLTKQTVKLDDIIYKVIIGFRNNSLDNYFKIITKFGNTETIIILLIIMMIVLPKKQKKQLLCSTIGATLINYLVKNIIRRKRPNHLRLIKQGGYSYPSGHAMISIAVYGYLLYQVIYNIKNRKIKYPLILVLLIIIVSIGISRIYLGVHYPSDIIGGYLLISIIEILMNDNSLGGSKIDKNDC